MSPIYSEKASLAGIKYNEDIAHVTDNAAWVMDGATGLGKGKLVSDESDAKWFVEVWNNFLINNINRTDKTIKELMLNGISYVHEKYLSKVGSKEVGDIDTPSASVVIVRWNEKELEYFALADCQIWIKEGDNIAVIEDERLPEFDDKVIKVMAGYINKGYSLAEAREAVQNLLIGNRLKKNTENGYWTLSFDLKALNYAQEGKMLINNNNHPLELLLCSDGFHCIVDKYKAMSQKEVFNYICKYSLDKLCNYIREIEADDLEGKKYPRFKKSDDASAVYLRFLSD